MEIRTGNHFTEVIANVTEALTSNPDKAISPLQRKKNWEHLPSRDTIIEIVEILRSTLFPGYFGGEECSPANIRFYVGAALDKAQRMLNEQIVRAFCFFCETDDHCSQCKNKADDITQRFLEHLPEVQKLLTSDVQAAYDGDPAATSPAETIFCYPSLLAVCNQRLAHKLYELKVPLIPRIITEHAHALTGIDIHPGASIGSRFFIDHGTGVVIGETSTIGNNVKIYQGVTLGAKSFPLDANGNPIKGIKRHPDVADDVTIYAEATILGNIQIGKGSTIGGNVWLTHSVPPNSRIMQAFPENNNTKAPG